MTQLSETSVRILKVIRDYPGLDGDQIRHFHFADDPTTGNNIKLLEQHGYIVYNVYNKPDHYAGWTLSEKGENVLKYG